MKKFEKIIIASDLDGTFYGENGSYVEKNLKAVEYFKENGGHFTAATGRDWFFALTPHPELKDICNTSLIAANGAYLYDPHNRKVSDCVSLDNASALEAVRKVQNSLPEILIRISQRNGYIYESDKNILSFDRSEYKKFCKFGCFDSFLDQEWVKIVFFGKPEQISEAERIMRKMNVRNAHIVSAQPDITEIIPKNGTKAAKLSSLKRLIAEKNRDNFDEYKIAAIGDYYNDFEMIAAADIPATVENSVDELKKIDGVYITCDHKLGAIADLIEHIEKTM